jgi:hypothetical protein
LGLADAPISEILLAYNQLTYKIPVIITSVESMDICASTAKVLLSSNVSTLGAVGLQSHVVCARGLPTIASSFSITGREKLSGTCESEPIRINIQRPWLRSDEIEKRHSDQNLTFSLENPWNHFLIQQNHRSQQEEMLTGEQEYHQLVETPAQILRSSRCNKDGRIRDQNYKLEARVESKTDLSVQSETSEERSRVMNQICNINLEQLSSSQLLDLLTSNKTRSIVVQKYIYTVWKQGFANIRSVVLCNMEYLATHALGNYVLQVLLLRDVHLRIRIEEACCKNFSVWKDDEYASRMMQCLLEVSSSFQYFLSNAFSKNPKGCAKNISCVFLTLALIRNCSDQRWLSFLREYVLTNAKSVLENRHMRRLIASLCEQAPQEFLDRFLSKMYGIISLDRIIREKSLTSILQTMIIRGHTQAVAVFENLLKYRVNALVVSSFFKYLLRKCARISHIGYQFLQHLTRKHLLRVGIDKILQENKPRALKDVVEWLQLSKTTICGSPNSPPACDQLIKYMQEHLAKVEGLPRQENLAYEDDLNL